jgi:hypothetical protein
MRYAHYFSFIFLFTACGADTKLPDAEIIVEGAIDDDGDGAVAGHDCDDENAMVYPGADELCNDQDDDCDGLVDEEGLDGNTYYRDSDGDGFGDATVEQSGCSAPAGFVADSTDCDDNRADVYPEAEEEDCTDPVDYNCDGSVGFADLDADGFAACNDCDDTNPAINPYAAEICNDGIDDNCDGEADEAGSVGEQIWFADADGDLHGDAATITVACEQPEGFVANATDCNDEQSNANPAGVEICDGIDNDCDGLVDSPDPIGGITIYPDSDGDGHGAAGSPIEVCTPLSGFVESSDDCDDSEPSAYPGADEICDGIDNDCSGEIDEELGSVYYVDPDGDGYGMALVSITACDAPDGYSALDGDCDETDPSVFPSAPEVCDGIDNDCSGGIDEDLGITVYLDTDGDGYGVVDGASTACSASTGFSLAAGDCDPSDSTINPAATEVCDSVDNDCDGWIDDSDPTIEVSSDSVWYFDGDDDGYGDEAESVLACVAPEGYLADSDDCDDTDASTYPGATEVWYDGIDQDCAGDGDSDADGDGYDAIEVGGSDDDDTDPSCWSDCMDGLTPDDAAFSCEALAEDHPSADNGWYWIAPEGVPMYVFCDIENGGWMQCFELENTDDIDLGTENTWLNDCIDHSKADWTGTEIRVTLDDDSGSRVYDETGTRDYEWTYDHITSTTSSGNQFYSYDHERLVSLSNGDKLMMAGQNASNSGCGGSLGNGYSVVIYPSSPDYYSNIKMLVMPHVQPIDGSTRSFSGWTAGHEISYRAGTMNTCSSTFAMAGTFGFWIR